ncbi:MAG: O-antigen ligase family protein [Phycisphaerales bacterium]|nr:O-antigen ligase family protein [Phycisphaerales bacterium]
MTSIAPEPQRHAEGRLTEGLLSAALAGLVCLKMLVTYDAFPGWGTDPSISDQALGVSISPTGLLGINAGIMLLAAAIVVTCRSCNGGLGRAGICIRSALLAIGLGGIAWHIALNPGTTVEDWLSGSDVAAALCSGAAFWRLAQRPRSGRIAAGILIGVVVMLAGKGALQVLVEHEQTVQTYKASREQILAANGWLPDSPSALAYERRLMQREASGWFGLSNVYGSIVGAGAIALTGLGYFAPRGGKRAILWLAALAAWTALAMSQSKGAIVAAVIGVGVIAGSLALPRVMSSRTDPEPSASSSWWQRPRTLGMISFALVLTVHAGIFVRGMLADRLGELSLWFRWFYVQGAARIFADHTLIGVGPAGFKDAYMLAKPPISPEDVASPHSLPWDLAAALGVFGVALAVLWFTWIWDLGRSLLTGSTAAGDDADSTQAIDDATARQDLRLIAAGVISAAMISIWIERTASTPETAITKIGGLLAWIIAAVVIAATSDRYPRAPLALGAAAIALAMHAQIEMTLTWTGSGAWVLAMIALAAGWSRRLHAPAVPPQTISSTLTSFWPSSLIALLGIACVLAGTLGRIGQVHRWEASLLSAADGPLDITRLRAAFVEIDSSRVSAAEKQASLAAACREAGLPSPAAGQSLEAFLAELSLAAWMHSLEPLGEATMAIPSHGPTHRALSQMALRTAEAVPDQNQREQLIARSLAEADAGAHTPRQRSAGLAWSAGLRIQLVKSGRIDSGTGLQAAREALMQAAQIDPYNFQHSAQLAQIADALGQPDQARTHAAHAIALEKAARLDPLRRMDDRTRLEMERLVATSRK